MSKIIIRETHRGALYEDGVFKGVLDAGAYPAANPWWNARKRVIVLVDVRQRSLTIKGQEILTADKVSIRCSQSAFDAFMWNRYHFAQTHASRPVKASKR